LFAPFSRKTLGAIATMLQKDYKGNRYQGPVTRDFVIPEVLKKKRLEELDWSDIAKILA